MLIGAVLSAPAMPTAHAARVIVNNENLEVQTPTLAILPGNEVPSGITYQANNAQSSTLSVYTEGFLFCANIPSTQSDIPIDGTSKFVPAHETRSGTVAHLWAFPGVEVDSIGYRAGVLNINRIGSGAQPAGLTCLATGASGEVPSGLTAGIFDNPFDSATAVNFNHLVNWMAPGGFDWTVASNWTDVPADPCTSNVNAPAKVVEDVACVAATGVRQGAPTGGERGPIVWSTSDGSNFTYVYRFDARYGPQLPGIGGSLEVPSLQQLEGATNPGSMTVTVREAIDSTYLGNQGAKYCMLAELPSQLTSSVCAGSLSFALPMRFELALDEGTPSQSFYVAVTHPIIGPPPNLAMPVVAVAAFVDPVINDLAIGGDKFSGDNIVFGFMPSSNGFPWMNGQ